MKTRRSFLFVLFGVLLGVLQIPWRKRGRSVVGFRPTSGFSISWPTIPALPAWCYRLEWLSFECERLVTDWATCSHMPRLLPHKLQIRQSFNPWSDQTSFELAISHRTYLHSLWETEVCDLKNTASRNRAIVTVEAIFKQYRELPRPSADDLVILQDLTDLLTFLRDYDDLQKIGPGGLKEVPVGTTV